MRVHACDRFMLPTRDILYIKRGLGSEGGVYAYNKYIHILGMLITGVVCI